jgi:hypothetical protein
MRGKPLAELLAELQLSQIGGKGTVNDITWEQVNELRDFFDEVAEGFFHVESAFQRMNSYSFIYYTI